MLVKNKYTYRIREFREGRYKFCGTIYVRNFLCKKTYWSVFGATYEEVEKNVKDIIHTAWEYSEFKDVIRDAIYDVKWFLKKLNPVIYEGMPLSMWRKASNTFKKPNLMFDFTTNFSVPYSDERPSLKWWNFIILYISDVDWKSKYRDTVFLDSPQVCLTFFRKWTLRWRWIHEGFDDAYWETLIDFVNGDVTEDDVRKTRYRIWKNPGEDEFLEASSFLV